MKFVNGLVSQNEETDYPLKEYNVSFELTECPWKDKPL